MKILFVCTGNTCRSPMAEALLKYHLGEEKCKNFTVASAATLREHEGEILAGRPANEKSIAVLSENGLSGVLDNHSSQWIGDLDISSYDKIICMSQGNADAVKELNSDSQPEVAYEAYGGVPNPYEKGMVEYRECYEIINTLTAELAKAL